MSKQPHRTCYKRNRPLPYYNPNCRTPRHWKFTQHHRTTRPPTNVECKAACMFSLFSLFSCSKLVYFSQFSRTQLLYTKIANPQIVFLFIVGRFDQISHRQLLGDSDRNLGACNNGISYYRIRARSCLLLIIIIILKKDQLSQRVFKHSLVLRKNSGWQLRHLRCLDIIQSFNFVALNVTHLRDITRKSLVDSQHIYNWS